jgi:hypothetical protein
MMQEASYMNYYETKRIEHAGYSTPRIPGREMMPYFRRTSSSSDTGSLLYELL